MSIFTRITATLGATADQAVSRFENHDAIAESALLQARQALAKARIRHKHLQNAGSDIRTRLERQLADEQRWTERARTMANGTDKERALECLAHRRTCRERIDAIELELRRHDAMEEGMTTRLQEMEQRLQGMTQQRNEMRSRESLAKATQVMDRVDSDGRDGVDAVFERWELSISDTEIRSDVQQDVISSKPSLQRDLEAQEEKAALQEELAALIAEKQ